MCLQFQSNIVRVSCSHEELVNTNKSVEWQLFAQRSGEKEKSMNMIAVSKGNRSWSLLLDAIYSPESVHKGQVVSGDIPNAPAQVFKLTLTDTDGYWCSKTTFFFLISVNVASVRRKEKKRNWNGWKKATKNEKGKHRFSRRIVRSFWSKYFYSEIFAVHTSKYVCSFGARFFLLSKCFLLLFVMPRTCLWSPTNKFKYLVSAFSTNVTAVCCCFRLLDYLIYMFEIELVHTSASDSCHEYIFTSYCKGYINVVFNSCTDLHTSWNSYGQSSTMKAECCHQNWCCRFRTRAYFHGFFLHFVRMYTYTRLWFEKNGLHLELEHWPLRGLWGKSV